MEQKESGFYETKKERGGDDVVGRKGQKAEKGVTLDELRFLFLKGIWKLEWMMARAARYESGSCPKTWYPW